jgi:hypothetical protein
MTSDDFAKLLEKNDENMVEMCKGFSWGWER